MQKTGVLGLVLAGLTVAGVIIGMQISRKSGSVQWENNPTNVVVQKPTESAGDTVNAPTDNQDLAGSGQMKRANIVDSSIPAGNVRVTLYPEGESTTVVVTAQLPAPKAASFYQAWLASSQGKSPLLVGTMSVEKGVYRAETIFDKAIIEGYQTLQVTEETKDDSQPEKIIITSDLQPE